MKRYCVKLAIVVMVSSVFSLIIYTSNLIEFRILFLLILYFTGVYYAFREMGKRLKKVFVFFLKIEFVSVIFGSIAGAMLSLLLLLVSIAFILGVGWIYGVYNCVAGMVDAYESENFSNHNSQE